MLAQAIGYGMLAVWGIVGLSVIGISLYGALRDHLKRWGVSKEGGEGPKPATGQPSANTSKYAGWDVASGPDYTMSVCSKCPTGGCEGHCKFIRPEQLARMEQRAVEAWGKKFEDMARLSPEQYKALRAASRPRLLRKAPSHFEPYTLRELLGERTVDE